jgi:probable phosphoglycerate mutase
VARSLHVALVRHAATAWTTAGRLQGRVDQPLAAEGRAALARWRLPGDLARCHAAGRLGWVASPLRRAVETAEGLGARALRLDARLVERDWGTWTGWQPAAVEAVAPGSMWEQRAPAGESPADVLARVRASLDALAEGDGPETWLVVTHGGVIEVLLAAAVRWDLQGPAPFRVLPERLHRLRRRDDGALQLLGLNEPLTVDP